MNASLWGTLKDLYNVGGPNALMTGAPTKDARTLYIDPINGDDQNSGETVGNPKKTPNGILDLCAADRGDWVWVAPGSHSVTELQEFDIRGVTFAAMRMGMPNPAMGENFTINPASSYADGPVGKVTQPTRFIGLGFAGRSLTEESLLVDCEETGGFNGGWNLFQYCRFSCWYGAINAGIRFKGGQWNMLKSCSFDGLFGGFGAAAIELEVSGLIDPGFFRVEDCYFSGVGSGIYAIKHEDKVLDYLYTHNHLLPGFLGNTGKFLDNDSTSSTGTASQNHFGGFANKAAVADNLAATCEFAGNYYDE